VEVAVVREDGDGTLRVTAHHRKSTTTRYSVVNSSQRAMPMMLINHALSSPLAKLVACTETSKRGDEEGGGRAVFAEPVKGDGHAEEGADGDQLYRLWLPLGAGETAVVRVEEENDVATVASIDDSLLMRLGSWCQAGVLEEEERTRVQVYHEATQRRAFLRRLVNGGGSLLSDHASVDDLSEFERRGWLQSSEIEVLASLYEARRDIAECSAALGEERSAQEKVDQAQARLRLNIGALTAQDGLKENSLVGRYVEAMAAEEEKLATSVATESGLLNRHKAAAARASSQTRAIKALVQARLDTEEAAERAAEE
jgi:hypothetical protein